MADHMIKLSEVPKGQKWQYLWDYYRFPALAAVIGLIFAVSLIKTIFFTPKADVGIIFTTELSLSDSDGEKFDKAVNDALEDYNGDGKKLADTTRLAYSETSAQSDPQYAQAVLTKINVELAAGNDILQICDDKLYPTYEGNGCLATYKVFSDFGVDIKHTGDDSEIVKIPFSEIKAFSAIKSANGAEMYLTVRPPMEKWYTNEKQRKNYTDQLKFIAKLVNE